MVNALSQLGLGRIHSCLRSGPYRKTNRGRGTSLHLRKHARCVQKCVQKVKINSSELDRIFSNFRGKTGILKTASEVGFGRLPPCPPLLLRAKSEVGTQE